MWLVMQKLVLMMGQNAAHRLILIVMGPQFWVSLAQTQVWRFLPLRLWMPRWCLPLTTASGQPRSLLWRTRRHRRVSLPAHLRVSWASRKSLGRLPGLLVVTLSLRVCLWPSGRLLAGAPFLDSVMGCSIIFIMLSILSWNCNGIRDRSKRVVAVLGDCENSLVLVKINEAPNELPHTALIG